MSSIKPAIAAAKIRKLSRLRPTLAIVLGSGFHHALSALKVDAKIPYKKLPGFPSVGVAGHGGELFIGKLGGTPALILSGRCHFYEGHPMERVTFAVRALAEYGIRDLLLTNAAGGVNKKFRAGDFMALTDHINLMGANPLRPTVVARASRPCEGKQLHADEMPAPLPSCFVDLTKTYDENLFQLLRKAALKTKINLRSGVYLAVSGPSYETPAEIRAFAKLDADAVGMSTVPEAIVARQCGLNVAGLSCITNLAAGRSSQPLSHKEVLETAAQVQTLAAVLLKNFAEFYGKR